MKNKTLNGEQISNLDEEQNKGLRSVLKKLKDEEWLIMKTDKSGKFCIVSYEDYIKMGQSHVRKDIRIERKDVIENSTSSNWMHIQHQSIQ